MKLARYGILAAAITALPLAAQTPSPTPTPPNVATSLNDVTTATAGTTVSFQYQSPALICQITGASAVGTVVIETSVLGSAYTTVGQIQSPSATGEMWAGPYARYARCRTVAPIVSGTFRCDFAQSNTSELGLVWKRIDLAPAQAVPTPTATWTFSPTPTVTPTSTPTRTPTQTPTP